MGNYIVFKMEKRVNTRSGDITLSLVKAIRSDYLVENQDKIKKICTANMKKKVTMIGYASEEHLFGPKSVLEEMLRSQK